ncbi:MAG: hypothetical protein ACI9MJ_000665, partial [Alphaproteobacteria bacterium]
MILPTFTRPHASPAGSAWLVTFADL